MGFEEPCEAGSGAVRNGAPGQQEHRPETAGSAAIPPAGELQDLGDSRNPDRDAQFEHINTAAIAMQAAGKPVISIDTKKKEPIGPYKNAGSDYRPKGCPEQVKVHDFVDAELGKVVPYGVYDITANAGCVSVGIDNDTAQFSVNSIRRWLHLMGRERYPDTDKLMITADGGGSNGSRVRLFKVELQKLADETRLALQVCHYPPGTSKWKKIEHRLFCYITDIGGERH